MLKLSQFLLTQKQIYRFIAVSALVAVMANITVPLGMAAVKYICNAEFTGATGVENTFGECCSSNGNEIEQEAANNKNEFCLREQLCKQVLPTEISEIPQILPATLYFPTVEAGVSFLSPQSSSFSPLFLNKIPAFHPPIFLLTEAFLN